MIKNFSANTLGHEVESFVDQLALLEMGSFHDFGAIEFAIKKLFNEMPRVLKMHTVFVIYERDALQHAILIQNLEGDMNRLSDLAKMKEPPMEYRTEGGDYKLLFQLEENEGPF